MERIGRLSYLQSLDLTGCPVTDHGLVYLARLDGLSHVSLAGSNVTPAGLKHLLTLKDLWFLNLSRTAVKKTDVEQLHKVLPRANILGGDGRDAWVVEGADTHEYFR